MLLRKIAEFSYFLICVLRSRSCFVSLRSTKTIGAPTGQELVEEIFGRGPVIHARVPTERALEWEKWPYGPIVDGWQLWRCFSFRAPNDGFLLNTLKTLFRLPRVLL